VAKGDQQKAGQRVGEENIAIPEQQRVSKADSGKGSKPPPVVMNGSGVVAGAAELDRKALPKQECEDRVHLPVDSEARHGIEQLVRA